MTTPTTPEPVWLVTDHHHPPRRLHLYGCEHLTGDRPDYDPDWREATAEELATTKTCIHCGWRAKRTGAT
jgi:hypothetical protein